MALVVDGPALAGLRIAVLSDLHLGEDPAAFERMAKVLAAVNAAKPDLIALLGDYTAHPGGIEDPPAHREAVAKLLASLTAAPVVAVLGNYESWDDREAWANTLSQQGITLLANDVARLEASGRALCVRGIGDAFTGHHRETPFPHACEGRGQLTLS